MFLVRIVDLVISAVSLLISFLLVNPLSTPGEKSYNKHFIKQIMRATQKRKGKQKSDFFKDWIVTRGLQRDVYILADQ